MASASTGRCATPSRWARPAAGGSRPFAREVEGFCPDAVHLFSAWATTARRLREAGVELPGRLRERIKGLDLDGEDFNREALNRSLRMDRALVLLWEALE